MARYRCTVCGEIYDDNKESVRFKELPDSWKCRFCHALKNTYMPMPQEKEDILPKYSAADLAVDPALKREDNGVMNDIDKMATTGRSIGEAMDTRLYVPKFDEILFLGAQLGTFPKLDSDPVDTKTVIGKNAEHPMILDTPIYVSHMSFGALSKSAKIALSKGSAAARTAMCSGEGGVLPEEKDAAYRYIFEYVPNKYSVTKEMLASVDAIEIKIGQGTKPGMGGHLPGEKVTPAIAELRGKPVGQDVLSPSRFTEINNTEDLRQLVSSLRTRSGGKPIGVKIAAGHIEKDLRFIAHSSCDFITIDGRGGATGSSPKFLKDNSSVPTVYALARARRYMNEQGMKQDLVITGGLRTSGDIAKALAMGADAVALSSAALMALGCQCYRLCNRGMCPMGIATQDPALEKRLDIEKGAARVANFLNVTTEELRSFARVSGHGSVHEFSMKDLCTISKEISEYTGIRHA